MRIIEGLDRITFDSQVMGGKPCIRGMRVTVGMIVRSIGAGISAERMLEAYPYLEKEDIQQALEFAARCFDEEQEFDYPECKYSLGSIEI